MLKKAICASLFLLFSISCDLKDQIDNFNKQKQYVEGIIQEKQRDKENKNNLAAYGPILLDILYKPNVKSTLLFVDRGCGPVESIYLKAVVQPITQDRYKVYVWRGESSSSIYGYEINIKSWRKRLILIGNYTETLSETGKRYTVTKVSLRNEDNWDDMVYRIHDKPGPEMLAYDWDCETAKLCEVGNQLLNK